MVLTTVEDHRINYRGFASFCEMLLHNGEHVLEDAEGHVLVRCALMLHKYVKVAWIMLKISGI